MNTGIYAIENTVNGKMYVGSAVNLKERRGNHFRRLRRGAHTNGKLQNSYNKHGGESFEFRILLVCRAEDLLSYEQLVIDKFDVVKNGYNIAPTAGSALGVKHSPKTKAIYGVASRTKWADPEYRARNIAAIKTGAALPEARANQSAAAKARWADPEYRTRNSAALKAAWAARKAA